MRAGDRFRDKWGMGTMVILATYDADGPGLAKDLGILQDGYKTGRHVAPIGIESHQATGQRGLAVLERDRATSLRLLDEAGWPGGGQQ